MKKRKDDSLQLEEDCNLIVHLSNGSNFKLLKEFSIAKKINKTLEVIKN